VAAYAFILEFCRVTVYHTLKVVKPFSSHFYDITDLPILLKAAVVLNLCKIQGRENLPLFMRETYFSLPSFLYDRTYSISH
jgi:hypothetical protein